MDIRERIWGGNADPEFWENIPDYYDISGGILHDTRYDKENDGIQDNQQC